MKILKLNNREVEIDEYDWEHGEGVYVLAAHYLDNNKDLSEEELLCLEDIYEEYLSQEAYEHAASAAYDRYKDSIKYGD